MQNEKFLGSNNKIKYNTVFWQCVPNDNLQIHWILFNYDGDGVNGIIF